MYLSAISSIRSLRERAKARASRSASAPVAPSRSWTSRSARVWSALPRRSSSASNTTSTTIAIATAGDTLRQPDHGAGNLLLVGADPLAVSSGPRLDQCGAGVLQQAVGSERRRVQVCDRLVAGPNQQGR